MATVPERLLGDNPWRRASLIIIALCLIVIGLTAALIDQRQEVQGLKAREEQRERAAEVSQAVQCFQSIADAPNTLALTDLLDRNARLRIQANLRLIRTDHNKARNKVRRRIVMDDRGARRAIRAIRMRVLQDVPTLSTCLSNYQGLGLDPKDLDFNLQELASISRDVHKAT